MKAVLSASDIARLEQVDRSTVLKWIDKGFFPHAFKPKDRRKWRIPLTDYETFQKQQKQQSNL